MEDSPQVRYRIANRQSLQAWLGEGGWAPLDARSRYLFTSEAVRRLAADRGQVVQRVRWRPLASLVMMWGTLLNTFTLGRNVALAALGRAAPTPAGRPWQRALDWLVSIVIALPLLLVALLLETGAAVAGRGGVIELTLRLE